MPIADQLFLKYTAGGSTIYSTLKLSIISACLGTTDAHCTFLLTSFFKRLHSIPLELKLYSGDAVWMEKWKGSGHRGFHSITFYHNIQIT